MARLKREQVMKLRFKCEYTGYYDNAKKKLLDRCLDFVCNYREDSPLITFESRNKDRTHAIAIVRDIIDKHFSLKSQIIGIIDSVNSNPSRRTVNMKIVVPKNTDHSENNSFFDNIKLFTTLLEEFPPTIHAGENEDEKLSEIRKKYFNGILKDYTDDFYTIRPTHKHLKHFGLDSSSMDRRYQMFLSDINSILEFIKEHKLSVNLLANFGVGNDFVETRKGNEIVETLIYQAHENKRITKQQLNKAIDQLIELRYRCFRETRCFTLNQSGLPENLIVLKSMRVDTYRLLENYIDANYESKLYWAMYAANKEIIEHLINKMDLDNWNPYLFTKTALSGKHSYKQDTVKFVRKCLSKKIMDVIDESYKHPPYKKLNENFKTMFACPFVLHSFIEQNNENLFEILFDDTNNLYKTLFTSTSDLSFDGYDSFKHEDDDDKTLSSLERELQLSIENSSELANQLIKIFTQSMQANETEKRDVCWKLLELGVSTGCHTLIKFGAVDAIETILSANLDNVMSSQSSFITLPEDSLHHAIIYFSNQEVAYQKPERGRMIELLIAFSPDLNYRSQNHGHLTPLELAVKHGCLDMMTELLRYPSVVLNATQSNNTVTFPRFSGNLFKPMQYDEFKAFITSSTNADSQKSKSDSLLSLAASSGNLDVIQLLFKHDKIKSYFKKHSDLVMQQLFVSIEKIPNLNCELVTFLVKFLFDNEQNLNKENEDENTPLMALCRKLRDHLDNQKENHANSDILPAYCELIDYLINCGAKVNLSYKDNTSIINVLTIPNTVPDPLTKLVDKIREINNISTDVTPSAPPAELVAKVAQAVPYDKDSDDRKKTIPVAVAYKHEENQSAPTKALELIKFKLKHDLEGYKHQLSQGNQTQRKLSKVPLFCVQFRGLLLNIDKATTTEALVEILINKASISFPLSVEPVQWSLLTSGNKATRNEVTLFETKFIDTLRNLISTSEALLISTLAHEDIKAIAKVYNKRYRSGLGRMAAQNMNYGFNLFNKEASFSSQSTASKKCMDLMDKAANDPGMIQASLCALIDYMRDGSNKERTLYRTVKQHLKSNLNKKTQGPRYK
jgi:ankyrin repeat protein